MNVKPDRTESVRFLEVFRPGGPWTLTAITEDQKKIETETFTTLEGAEAWIADRNGKSNIYFMVNPVLRPLSSKAKKTDVRGMAWLHVDVDPRVNENLDSERRRIEKLLFEFQPSPTIIVDSGGGYQGFWKLEEEIPTNGDENRAIELEAYNRQLELLLGADSCHNIDRIMRLPGTINIPNAKKRSKGRTEALAMVMREEMACVYPLKVFTPAQRVVQSAGLGGFVPTDTVKISGNLPRIDLNADLPEKVSERIKSIIVQGDDVDKPYNSKSEAVFAVACEMVRAGCTDDQIAAVLLDRDFLISQHIYRQSRPRDYAARQIRRAKDFVALNTADFRLDRGGKVVANDQGNIRLALSRLGVTLSHDVFKDRFLVSGIADFGPLLDDRAMDDLWLLVDETFGFRPTKDLFWTVVQAAARKNKFHPVRDYLDGLRWDGVLRVDTWLIEYGGAADTPYTRAVGALMLVAAVRRIREPGCKFDEMLVLESGQGKDKSSALKVLAVEEGWFTDDMPLNADTKRVIEQLRGSWIVECAELQGMRRSELEHIKAFCSRQVDRARLSYDRTPTEVPRQCIFFGTTNSTRYLRDVTGARRFWPVAVQTFDIPKLARDRDQLWAEAVMREARGDSIRLDPSLYGDAATEQKKRSVEDPFRDQIEHVLGNINGKIWNADVWDILAVQPGQRTQEHNARMGEAMRACGWERSDLRIEGKVSKVYVRGTEEERKSRIFIRRDDKGNVKRDDRGYIHVYLEGQPWSF